jgi:RNA polymerase sigma-70 factor (ECF subfamily)
VNASRGDLSRAGNQPASDAGTAIRHSTEVFAELYEQYMPMVFRFFSYRVGEIHLAEDLTSAVFEKALTRFESYKADRASFATWLFSIARNTLIDHFRVSGRRKTLPIDEMPMTSNGGNSPENGVIHKEELKQLQVCLAKLSPQEQEIISLKFGGEMTNRQIAKMLGLSESNVGTIIYRSVKKLRDNFTEWRNGQG